MTGWVQRGSGNKGLTTTQQGLGRAHQLERARLLPLAEGQICWRCGRVMHIVGTGRNLELDHVIPRALGGGRGPKRIVHRSCNQLAGAKLGGQRSKAKRLRAAQVAPAPPARRVRQW